MNIRERDLGLFDAWQKAYAWLVKKKMVRQVQYSTQNLTVVGAHKDREADVIMSPDVARRCPNAVAWLQKKGYRVDVLPTCGNIGGEYVAFGYVIRRDQVSDVARAIVMIALDLTGLLKPEVSATDERSE